MEPKHCATSKLGPAILSIAILGFAMSSRAQAPFSAQPSAPSIAETNKTVGLDNAYRRLILKALVWRESAGPGCSARHARIGGDAQDLEPVDTAQAHGDQQILYELQQRLEENDLSETAELHRDVHEAITNSCLILNP